MRIQMLTIATLLLSGTGCAGHATMYGTVVMRLNETQAHVCLHEGSVAVGDSVQLIRHVCDQGDQGRTAARVCRSTVAGTGVVEELLNEHYSRVVFPAELTVREGDTVRPVD